MSLKKIRVEDIVGLFILSIPMMPVFTMPIYYFLGVFVVTLFLLYILKHKVNFMPNYFESFFVLFIVWNIFSLIWSVTGEKSIIKWCLIHFAFVVCALRLLYFSLKSADKVVEKIGKWYVAGTLLVSIICIFYEYLFYSGNFRLGTYLFREPYGTRMMYTYSLEISMFFVLYDFFENKNLNSKKIFQFFLILFFTICIFLSGTRKILIGIAVFILFYIILKNKKDVLKAFKKIALLVLMAVVCYFCIMNIDFLYDVFGSRVESAIGFINGTAIDASIRDRNAMIDYGFSEFLKHPIKGNGSNYFHYGFNLYYGQDLYSHNNFIELLCNLGFIGFGLYYLIYFFSIFTRSKSKHKTFFQCVALSLLILDYWTISYYRIQFLIIWELMAVYFSMIKLESGEKLHERKAKKFLK